MSDLPPSPPDTDEPEGNLLIFQWRGRPWKGSRLAVTLLLSLLGHAATFYLLQVAYTPTGSLQPPAAQVVLLAPVDPAEKAALNEWLKMADPALMTAPPGQSTADVLDKIKFRYVPSYAAAQPAFKPLEPASAELTAAAPERSRRPGPVPVAPGDLLAPAAVAAASMSSVAAAVPTKLVFRGPIEPLAPTSLPPLKFSASQNGRPLEPTMYLVGVKAGGGPPWLFRQPATGETAIGDTAIDEATHDYLARLDFRPPPAGDNPHEVVWGWATFYWGREVYR